MKDEDWFAKWEDELPAPDELMPLTQNLITPDLAAAFKIHHRSSSPPESVSVFPGSVHAQLHQTAAGPPSRPAGSRRGSNWRKRSRQWAEAWRRMGAEGGGGRRGGGGGEEPARTLKRPRLVWTPPVAQRFVDAVAHLGIKNAVPKTIMQLMNVEGLTRENVASHLQKYRLYLKRMQGLSSEGPSSCDHLFASTPVPASHFLHRDDMVMPLVPMGVAGLGHGHMVAAATPPPHYASFDPRFWRYPRQPPPPPPQSQQRTPPPVVSRPEFVMVNDLTPGNAASAPSPTPPRQVLTLFPTGDN